MCFGQTEFQPIKSIYNYSIFFNYCHTRIFYMRSHVRLQMVGSGKHFFAEHTWILLVEFVNGFVLLDGRLRGEAFGAEGAEEGSATVSVLPLYMGH